MGIGEKRYRRTEDEIWHGSKSLTHFPIQSMASMECLTLAEHVNGMERHEQTGARQVCPNLRRPMSMQLSESFLEARSWPLRSIGLCQKNDGITFCRGNLGTTARIRQLILFFPVPSVPEMTGARIPYPDTDVDFVSFCRSRASAPSCLPLVVAWGCMPSSSAWIVVLLCPSSQAANCYRLLLPPLCV